MFREAIQGVVDQLDGGLAGMVIDLEGIPLESYQRGQPALDVESLAAEASVLVKSIQRAGEMLEVGDTREVQIRSERSTTLIRLLNDTYFMALTLSPDANVGKARYLLRVAAPGLLAELS